MSWIFPALALAFTPKEGFVPDSATAVKIAEAVATPIYGEKVLKEERPLKAVLRDGVWVVLGHLGESPYIKGGVVEVRIKKATGEVLEITHGR